MLTYEQYCDLQAEESLPERYLILRHDVDKLPQNSFRTAEIEHALGVRATYYFRVYPKQADEQQYIRNIAALWIMTDTAPNKQNGSKPLRNFPTINRPNSEL